MKEYNIVNLMAREGVINAIKRYGLERTEDKIKSCYKLMPTIKKLMLKEYNKLIWRKK